MVLWMDETPPRGKFNMAGASVRALLVIVLCAELIYLANISLDQRATSLRSAQYNRVLETASLARSRVEQGLSSTIYLAHGLVALIKSAPNLDSQQIQRALATLHNADPRVRNIGLAPDNVLSHVYPRTGNENAIGLRYAELPRQWPSVKRAMDTGKTVITGPVELVQGGSAVVSRTPVYMDDGRYWGVISIVIDLPGVMRDAGVSPLMDDVMLHIAGPADGHGDVGWMLGDGQLAPGKVVELPVQVGGGQWMLYAQPQHGWQQVEQSLLRWRVLFYGSAVALSLFIWLILDSRARARSLARRLQETNQRLAASNDALEYMSRYDALTNVANRRYFDDMLEHVLAQAARRKELVTLMMIDVDYFKAVNDTHGHAVGDQCLQRVAQMIVRSLQRGEDLVARFGGEEFVVLASGLDKTGAMALAERIRGAIAGTLVELSHDPHQPLRMTASIGVAQMRGDPSVQAKELCRRADAAMYAAKHAGRNCVRTFDAAG